MSMKSAVSMTSLGRSGGSEATVLRLVDAGAPTRKLPLARVIAPEDPEMLDVWRELLDGFLDRRAAERFHHYAECHAGYSWKPELALVLPAGFSADRPAHRRDLSVALEVLASVMDHYNIAVVSDSPDAARLFHKVVPFSPQAISGCAGALVLLERSLNDQVAAIRPSRLVAADPCAYRINQKRIVFAAGGAELPLAPVDEGEIARDSHGTLAVLLDEDDEVPAFFAAIRRLRIQGLALRLTLSSRADEDFARRVHAAFDDDPRVDVHDPEPGGSLDVSEYQMSNDIITLLTQRRSSLPRFLFRNGELWRLGLEVPRRADFYLFRGEESNGHGLLSTWLGPRRVASARPPIPDHTTRVEPLVSIVVPTFDATTEVVRLAHSIYGQDYPWIEVIFVAHGSPPETIEAIRVAENYLMKRRFHIHIIESSRGTGSAAFPCDLGIRASSGDLVCVLPTGDWLDPGFFAFLSSGLWRIDTLYRPCPIYDRSGRAVADDTPGDWALSGPGTLEPAELVWALRRPSESPSSSGVCFARSLFDRGGGIDHRIRAGGDLYLWWRLALAGARTEAHDGRVNISVRAESHPPFVGQGSPGEEVAELARSQELIPWL